MGNKRDARAADGFAMSGKRFGCAGQFDDNLAANRQPRMMAFFILIGQNFNLD